jgi:hypothetical protein
MKFKLFREFGALNSPPVFDAFEQGIRKIGMSTVTEGGYIPVIWSVLWNGRMKNNQKVYYSAIDRNIPVVIIEVGNLRRGITWRISVNNVNRLGYFGEGDIDADRPKKLGIRLDAINQTRRSEILIACQHKNSLQWPKDLSIEDWLTSLITQIKSKTERKIIVRPHPRFPINLTHPSFIIDRPVKLTNTYDDFNFDHTYHVVINHNTGPSVNAAIKGTPVICDQSGLAYPVSETIENIENPSLKDREDWLIDLSHTEWTLDEIAAGLPQKRLIGYLELKYS